MPNEPRLRDLALVRKNPGSPRIFDLARLCAGESSGFDAGADVSAPPFFAIPRMNRTLIIKHTLRPHEREEIGPARRTATKIIFPIELSDLSMGGAGLFAEEVGFARKLRTYLTGADGAKEHFNADLRRVRILSELPMFDRFLLRERCRMAGLDCPDALVEADNNADKAIRDMLFKHIQQLFLGATGSKDMARRIAEGFCFKVFSSDFAAYAERLNEFFGLEADQMVEALFAWKCLIYQSALFEKTRADIASDLKCLLHASIPSGVRDGDRDFALRTLDACRRQIRAQHSALKLRLAQYNSAYNAFSQRREPGPFIQFLKSAPDFAFSAGESLSLLLHYSGFIGYRLRREKAMSQPASCIEFFQDLALSLEREADQPMMAEV